MDFNRRKTRKIKVGNAFLGGNSSVKIQSMLNIPAEDIKGNVAQAAALEKAGCEIIRTAVPNMEAIALIEALKKAVSIPVVADIHFDYRLALAAVDAGADKIRINPGNIGDDSRIKAVADKCRGGGVPIRIGVNSGSVEKELLEKYGGPTPEALAASAIKNAKLLEKFDFNDIVISIKSSDVRNTYAANIEVAKMCEYPLHLGVTEAGTELSSAIKSSAALGGLLLAGIGDTVRISITGDPVREVVCAKELLKSLGLKKGGITFVSCPTCGRTKIDLVALANAVEQKLCGCDKTIKVAVMGCVVNGPGEAREADIGVAGGDGCGVIFRKGKIIKKVPEDRLLPELLSEVDKL